MKTRALRIFSLLLALVLLTTSALASLPGITGQAAMVLDAETGQVLLSKNCDTPRAVASTTKLMTLYLAFDAMGKGEIALDTEITISDYAARLSNDTTYSGNEAFSAGDTVSLETLLGLIVTASANGSAVAVAEAISGSEEAFVARMNNTCADWGIDAVFVDASGIGESSVSARAMATIALHCVRDYPAILDYTSLSSVTYNGQTFTSTDEFLTGGYTYDGIDGLKTGYTSAAGYCFVGACLRDGRRLVSVVLGESSNDLRFLDTIRVLDYGYAVADDSAVPLRIYTVPSGQNLYRQDYEPASDTTAIPDGALTQ
jgi:D-alanyl-D-alanine carboxypeptidase